MLKELLKEEIQSYVMKECPDFHGESCYEDCLDCFIESIRQQILTAVRECKTVAEVLAKLEGK